MNLTESVVIYVDDSGSMWGREPEVEAIFIEYGNPRTFRVGNDVGPWDGPKIGSGKPNVQSMINHASAWWSGEVDRMIFITDEVSDSQWHPEEQIALDKAGIIMRQLPHRSHWQPPKFSTPLVSHPIPGGSSDFRYGTSTVMSVWGEKDEQFARERDNLSAFENLTPRQQVWITERVRLGIESFLKKEAFPGVVGAGTEMVPQGEIPYFEFTFRIYPDSTYPGGK